MEYNELKEVNIKNCLCHYFDDIIKIEDFDNISIDEISYKNIAVYDISYKTLLGSKPLGIRFDEVSGFIKVYYVIRYLVFGPRKHDAIYHRNAIYNLISQKNVQHLFFLTIMQISKLIYMILYLYKRH